MPADPKRQVHPLLSDRATRLLYNRAFALTLILSQKQVQLALEWNKALQTKHCLPHFILTVMPLDLWLLSSSFCPVNPDLARLNQCLVSRCLNSTGITHVMAQAALCGSHMDCTAGHQLAMHC